MERERLISGRYIETLFLKEELEATQPQLQHFPLCNVTLSAMREQLIISHIDYNKVQKREADAALERMNGLLC